MSRRPEKPTEDDYALANQVAEWMASLAEAEQTNDYLYNLGIYGKAGIVNPRGIGIVASAIAAFNRNLAWEASRADTRPVVSKHIGKAEARILVQVRVVRVIEISGFYGPRYIHKFEIEGGEDAGARLTWFGRVHLYRELTDEERAAATDDGERCVGRRRVAPGDVIWVKGTIKEHGQYDGVQETYMSRMAWVDDPETTKTKKRAAAKAKRDAKKARKVFGDPKTVATYGEERANGPVELQRVVQLAEHEFIIERLWNDKWNRDRESHATFEAAHADCSAGGGWGCKLLSCKAPDLQRDEP